MKINLNKMCYPRFIEYLNENGIQYEEEVAVDLEEWFTEYTIVSPLFSKLKTRFFDNDGGGQLLDF